MVRDHSQQIYTLIRQIGKNNSVNWQIMLHKIRIMS
jgi:hypothetical protein